MKNEVAEVLESVAVQIQNNMQAQGINASGRTSESFHIEIDDNGVRLVAGGEGTAPIGTLEVGRKAGDVPQGFQSIIKQWIKDKGITVAPLQYSDRYLNSEAMQRRFPPKDPTERGLDAMAGAIAHNIAEKGTDRHRNPRNDIYSNVVPDAVIEIEKVILDNVVKTLTIH